MWWAGLARLVWLVRTGEGSRVLERVRPHVEQAVLVDDVLAAEVHQRDRQQQRRRDAVRQP